MIKRSARWTHETTGLTLRNEKTNQYYHSKNNIGRFTDGMGLCTGEYIKSSIIFTHE